MGFSKKHWVIYPQKKLRFLIRTMMINYGAWQVLYTIFSQTQLWILF